VPSCLTFNPVCGSTDANTRSASGAVLFFESLDSLNAAAKWVIYSSDSMNVTLFPSRLGFFPAHELAMFLKYGRRLMSARTDASIQNLDGRTLWDLCQRCHCQWSRKTLLTALILLQHCPVLFHEYSWFVSQSSLLAFPIRIALDLSGFICLIRWRATSLRRHMKRYELWIIIMRWDGTQLLWEMTCRP